MIDQLKRNELMHNELTLSNDYYYIEVYIYITVFH